MYLKDLRQDYDQFLRPLSLSKLRLYLQFRNQAHNRLDSTLILATAGTVGNQPVSLFYATPMMLFVLYAAGGIVPKEARQRQ